MLVCSCNMKGMQLQATTVFKLCLGCPAVVRFDPGMENGLLAAAQIAFRSCGTDSLAGNKSIRYGPSPANVVSLVILL